MVAISLCLALLGASAGAARAAESPIGAHSMLQLNSPYPFMQTMFAEAAAMHASAIRLDVAPALVFHDPLQPPDFTGLDEVVALANAYHLRVVADLTTIPWWISACATPRDISQMTLCGTDDLADYRAEITEIVRRADPAIHDWEIWNEPDLGSFFSGTPLQYAWMLRTAARRDQGGRSPGQRAARRDLGSLRRELARAGVRGGGARRLARVRHRQHP